MVVAVVKWAAMRLLLLRHGVAVPSGTPGYPGDDRPLTEEGARKMARGAQGLARIAPRVDRILTSPLKRARATADLAAKALGCEGRVEVCQDLLPGALRTGLLARLKARPASACWLLVGHEPALGELAGALAGCGSLPLRKGGLCRIDLVRGRGTLVWMLSPRLLRILGKGR